MSITAYYLRLAYDRFKKIRDDPNISITDYIVGGGIDIDKAWEGIQALLSGFRWEGRCLADWVIYGDKEVSEPSYEGGDPARLLKPYYVKEVAQFLKGITKEKLYRKYDPSYLEQRGTYPGYWVRNGDKAFEYLWPHFEELKDLYLEAAKANECVVSIII